MSHRVLLKRGAITLGAIVLLGLLLPVAQVGCTRFVAPSFTPMMAQRWLEARLSGKTPTPIRSHWIPITAVPRAFLHNVWAAEDQRFFEHHGIDWEEIDLALAESKRSGKPPRGASTITMQCARSIYLWQGRSWIRKGLETYYTWLMELMLSKRRILELYVNGIEMGDGVYGIHAAAYAHFGEPPDKLSPRQLATLAALLPNPRGWSVATPPPKLTKRVAKVLRETGRTTFPYTKIGLAPDRKK